MAAAAGKLGRRRLPLRSAPGLQLPRHPMRRPESGRRTTPFLPAIVGAACRPIPGRFGRRVRFPGLSCIWKSPVPRENVGGQCPAGRGKLPTGAALPDSVWNRNADLDGDSHVGQGDLGIVLADWHCGV